MFFLDFVNLWLTKISFRARFLDAMAIFQDSCKKLCSITTRIVQNFPNLKESCKNLQKIKFSVDTLRSDNLWISQKSKHNQPLQVKFDELYTC